MPDPIASAHNAAGAASDASETVDTANTSRSPPGFSPAFAAGPRGAMPLPSSTRTPHPALDNMPSRSQAEASAQRTRNDSPGSSDFSDVENDPGFKAGKQKAKQDLEEKLASFRAPGRPGLSAKRLEELDRKASLLYDESIVKLAKTIRLDRSSDYQQARREADEKRDTALDKLPLLAHGQPGSSIEAITRQKREQVKKEHRYALDELETRYGSRFKVQTVTPAPPSRASALSQQIEHHRRTGGLPPLPAVNPRAGHVIVSRPQPEPGHDSHRQRAALSRAPERAASRQHRRSGDPARARALRPFHAARRRRTGPVDTVEALGFEARDGTRLETRAYYPRAPNWADPKPVLLFFHAGGYVVDSLRSADALCRMFAVAADCAVISVDYRLAPEHRFPCAIDDVVDALCWLHREACVLGLDATRIAVGGESSGATLAAVCAVHAREAGLPLALQLLIYPDLSAASIPMRIVATARGTS